MSNRIRDGIEMEVFLWGPTKEDESVPCQA